jgi:hypothetical protein
LDAPWIKPGTPKKSSNVRTHGGNLMKAKTAVRLVEAMVRPVMKELE